MIDNLSISDNAFARCLLMSFLVWKDYHDSHSNHMKLYITLGFIKKVVMLLNQIGRCTVIDTMNGCKLAVGFMLQLYNH